MSLLLVLAAAAAPGIAMAGNAQAKALAKAVGISETEVRQLMGWSPLTYYQFRQDHSRTSAKVIRALGQDRYDRLMAGQPILIEGEMDGRRVAFEVQLGR
ncbi:hypothetical protein [Agrilutibacter solisilvae]|uniref:Uncharacterized protein n=1 Tax=Agrilutibacter solisilvae TaxID=2763317 RepID=A0A974Y124_9GAMM|nr:hypothetical protein [Lysobacter solisilvae]QSX79476.1 hypothetical protein I8J32_006340 [Lysobacter solisilvae]